VLAWSTTGDGSLVGSRPVLDARALLMLLFITVITATMLWAVLHRSVVTLDTVLGAVCVFLLLGALWAVLYDVAALHRPDAFRMPDEPPSASPQRTSSASLKLPDSLYFSYVTLTTVGYGDIIPISRATRTLAWMEAVTGQIYLIVLVARLVAVHVAHSEANRRRSED
jgi:hypothetical protein